MFIICYIQAKEKRIDYLFYDLVVTKYEDAYAGCCFSIYFLSILNSI